MHDLLDLLDELRRPIEQLHKLANEPIPALDGEGPSTQEDLERALEASKAWARTLARLATGNDDAVSNTSDDRAWSLYDLLKVSHAGGMPPSLRDLTGPPPDSLRSLGHALLYFRPADAALGHPGTLGTDDVARIQPVRQALLDAFAITRFHALDIVRWARGRILECESAYWPVIIVRDCTVQILHAGGSRDQDLTAGHIDILRRLLEDGTATANRNSVRSGNDDRALLTRIPELGQWIKTTTDPDDIDNGGVHVIDKNVQRRMRIE